jgi:hypothetical protein
MTIRPADAAPARHATSRLRHNRHHIDRRTNMAKLNVAERMVGWLANRSSFSERVARFPPSRCRCGGQVAKAMAER